MMQKSLRILNFGQYIEPKIPHPILWYCVYLSMRLKAMLALSWTESFSCSPMNSSLEMNLHSIFIINHDNDTDINTIIISTHTLIMNLHKIIMNSHALIMNLHTHMNLQKLIMNLQYMPSTYCKPTCRQHEHTCRQHEPIRPHHEATCTHHEHSRTHYEPTCTQH